MSLSNLERITVETIREYRGKITLVMEDNNSFTPTYADWRLNKDIAIALQGYFARMNKYYGDELKADL